NRGHSVFRSVAASPPRRRKNAERTRQQMPRPAHSSRSQQLSNMAARNILPAQPHLGIIMDLKSHLPAQVAQHLNVARRFVSKVEVVALVDLPRMQTLRQNFM